MQPAASQEEENGPQVPGEATSAMHDVANICQENDGDDPKELEVQLGRKDLCVLRA